MFQEMRHAALIQKPLHGAESMSARTVFELATLGGAAALGLEDEVGSLEPGKKADIVLLDLDQSWNPSGGTEETIYSSCVYSGSPSNVHSVMVDGRWLFRDGVLRTFDEQETNRGARKEARALLERISA